MANTSEKSLRRSLKEWESWDTVYNVWKYNRNPASAVDTEIDVFSWHYNIWLLNYDDLITMTYIILDKFNLPKIFKIDAKAWRNFIFEVERLMTIHTNPYHNFTHIMDVFQSTSVMILDWSVLTWITELDCFALLLSALTHDLEHPGTNNAYQVNSSSMLAIRYNDMAVLENFHCARAFEVFTSQNMAVFSGLTSDQKKYLRKTMISLILATDMAAHFALKDELDAFINRFNNDEQKVAPMIPDNGRRDVNEKDRLTIMKSIMHTADISNPGKPWTVSKKWSDLVLQEFFLQGDREKNESLPISMNCDRLTTNQDELSLNFNDFIVAPFFFSLARLFPRTLKCCKILEANRNAWNTILKERLSASSEFTKIDDIIVKWEARTNAFTEKMRALETLIGENTPST